MKPTRQRVLRRLGTAMLVAGVAASTVSCGQSEANIRVLDTETSGDGTLKIGLLLESTGEQKFLNDSQRAGVELALKEINDAGGLKGQPVELLPSQAGEATAVAAQDFIDGGADVVIGPTDSSHASTAIDLLSDAGVAIISPANGAAALSDYSSGGYYFRTYPSTELEVGALTDQLRSAGKHNVVIIHDDSTYGSTVSDALAGELSASDGSPVLVSMAAGAPEVVSETGSADPDAVVVVARGTSARTVIFGLVDSEIAPANLYLGSGATGAYGDALSAKALEGAHGIHPGGLPEAEFQHRVLAVDAGLDHLTFTAEAYDAIVLAALAAAAARDDAGASIASHLLPVSGNHGAGHSSGTVCTAVDECLELLRSGEQVDYQGQSGPISFNADGDVGAAKFSLYSYGPDNRPVPSGTVLVKGSDPEPRQ